MKHCYPAIFRLKGEGLPGYTLCFPDVPGCFTMGDDIEDCVTMAQDALGLMLEDIDEKDYPKPSLITDIDISKYPEGTFLSYVCFDKELYDENHKLSEREAILKAEIPIRELLNRRRMKIKDLAEIIGAPYRTTQDWALGYSSPPKWTLNLILDKILETP